MKMNTEEQITAIRAELTAKIRSAIEMADGCIGTYYKNRSVHHSEIDIENIGEYDGSPFVVTNVNFPADFDGFMVAYVCDIYIDPETSELMIPLNRETDEDFDKPLGSILLEGMIGIVEWLNKYGFIVREKENPRRCEKCDSLNI